MVGTDGYPEWMSLPVEMWRDGDVLDYVKNHRGAVRCGKCGSTRVVMRGNVYTCRDCDYTWVEPTEPCNHKT